MSKALNYPALYSALEVANICGVVNQTAINWIRSGHLNAFTTPGGQYRIYADDLAGFMIGRGMRVPPILSNRADNRAVLVVDDDRGLNTVIARYFGRIFPDYAIYQSFDGFDAGVQLADKKPGFVILDVDLPGIDGASICRRLKTTDDFGRPFVIIITALEDPGLRDAMIKLGADLFFKKPLVLKNLSDSIMPRCTAE